MSETLFVNLFAGPGSGKSTTAAGAFSLCKLAGINAELVTEYAKDKVWEQTTIVLQNQIYVFGKQNHRMYRLKDQVDVAITDSPLVMGCMYGEPNSELDDLVVKTFKSYNNLNYFINRVKPYNPKGRMQDEAGARILDQRVKGLLATHEIPYTCIDGDASAMCTIASNIYQRLTGGILQASITLNKVELPAYNPKCLDLIKNEGGTTC